MPVIRVEMFKRTQDQKRNLVRQLTAHLVLLLGEARSADARHPRAAPSARRGLGARQRHGHNGRDPGGLHHLLEGRGLLREGPEGHRPPPHWLGLGHQDHDGGVESPRACWRGAARRRRKKRAATIRTRGGTDPSRAARLGSGAPPAHDIIR
jgi:hypothetical protein